jgi:hypothetical protein
LAGVAFLDEHVYAGAVEQRGEDCACRGWPIASEDTLFGDPSGDLHACLARDGTENLVEA